MNALFPIFVKMNQIHTLVVGGGNVGLEKVESVYANSPEARVTLVAPWIKDEIKEMARKHQHLQLHLRPFEKQDLEGKHLVICATDNKPLHQEIVHECRMRQLLINVADTPDLCDMYLSSVVRKGNLKIAISTNGKSPTFAKRLKEVLHEALAEDDLNVLLDRLEAIRAKLKGDFGQKVIEMNRMTEGLAPL